MSTLSEKLNMAFGDLSDDGAHVMRNVNLGLAAYDTLSYICSELDFDLSKVADSDFDSAAIALKNFCNSANMETGYTVSVWFDS
jgi:hypothetical protein